MSIFGVMLFAFALTLTSCGDGADATAETTVCANTGEACLDDHSCCAPAAETDAEAHDHEGEAHDHEGGNEEHTH